MKRAILISVAAVLLSAASAAAQTIFIVRHAERADATPGATMMANDPELSPAGRERAAALASMLRDAGIAAIYVSEYKRTQQTAEPLANARGLRPTIVPAKDTAALVGTLRSARGNVLVVGHSNSIPDSHTVPLRDARADVVSATKSTKHTKGTKTDANT